MLKFKVFASSFAINGKYAQEQLCDFVNKNKVKVVSITQDKSGNYSLFYEDTSKEAINE